MDLSIIIPVYNVEEYVHPCLESIFRQGLDDSRFEVIIVNDGSTDKSMEMIADIISQHNNITVINQQNQGLSMARNNGFAMSKGEYIMMPDSDDLLIENSVKPLLEKALETKADMIVADFLRMEDEEIGILDTGHPTQPPFETEEKTGHELLKELNPFTCYVWRALYRRDFLLENNIRFIPDIYYEDIPFTHECYLKAGKCIKSRWMLNIYRERRTGSITSSIFTIDKAKRFILAIAATWKLRKSEVLPADVLYKLEEDVFVSFSKLIYNTVRGKKSTSERNMVMDNVKALAPNLDFTHNLRQRITTFLMKKAPHLFINVYYLWSKLFHR